MKFKLELLIPVNKLKFMKIIAAFIFIFILFFLYERIVFIFIYSS